MDITRLRHIVAVSDTLSFSRAAEQQNITQPALSRSIAAFEARHGLRLFDRSRGGVTLTPSGSFVVEQARAMIRASDEFSRNVKLYTEGAAGRVAFGLGPLLGSLLLPDLARRLLAHGPELEIITAVKSPDQLLADLFDNKLEMIIGNVWQVSEVHGVALEEIGSLDLVHVVRRDHPLTQLEKVTPEALAAYPVARPVRLTGDQTDAGTFVCDNFHVLREMVEATDCSWITTPSFVHAELASGSLQMIDVEGFSNLKSGICVITLAGRTRSPVSRMVSDLVRMAMDDLGAEETASLDRTGT
ncbi:hypothetical protein NSU_0567 [Novosphingobium pentaromativorans US6-1]|uniref:HTH lysR-type domain-containing protein n=2 Tax=Novosphingobium pentaromativorans TaxID=205844 RepID=G6E896_9SPHN|nr:hypothetical protein NSU_0567 [Novosphingobium pentaromativorans US6-1]